MKRIFVAVLFAASALVGPAAVGAHALDVGGCSALGGGVTITPGITLLPHSNDFDFTGGFDCIALGNANGHWAVKAHAKSDPSETCLAAFGTGTFTGDKGPHGNGLSGSFTFVRVGVLVVAEGQIQEANYPGYTFIAVLVFTPNQDCVVTPVTSATLTGAIALGAN